MHIIMTDRSNYGTRCWRKELCGGLLETLAVDDLDMKIIRILSANARMSNVDIANRIGVSEGTVRRRINEMVKNGIIEGFILLLNCKEAEKCVKAFISMEIADSDLQGVADELLKDHERIVAIYRTNTKFNLLCEAMFRSVIELQEFIDVYCKLEGIRDSKVKMVIGSYKKCLWTGI
ncbi:MAG: winged helix-turn-helix transcriptional regulator [Nitrospiraceae bacterium]|nr:winged helix-turn-helix transcriptional regulator [Nitrospiraceae bacterium]